MTIRGQKSWIRRWLHRAGIAVAVLLLLVPVAGVALHLYGRACFARATSELEALLGEELVFDFAHLETPPLPRYDNAAEWLLDGVEALDFSHDEKTRIDQAWLLARREWPPELEASARALIGRHRPGLETLHKAAEIERSSYGIRYRDGNGARIPRASIMASASAARLLNAEARLAFADGDVDRGLAAARALARIARALDQEHFLFFLFYEMSVERSLNRLVFEVLQETAPWAANPALLAELEALLPTRNWLEKAREVLVLEGSMFSASVRHGAKTSPHGERTPPWPIRYLFGHLVAAETLVGTRKSVALLPLSYGRAQDRFDEATSVAPAKSLYDTFDNWSSPYQSRVRCAASAPAMIAGTIVQMLAAVPHSTARDASANSWGRWLGAMLKVQVIATERQLLRAAITLRRDAVAGGGYPRERPEIAALAAPDPFTGRLIAYRPGDDGSLRLELEGAMELLAERWGGRSWMKEGKERRDWVKRWLRDKIFAVTLPPG